MTPTERQKLEMVCMVREIRDEIDNILWERIEAYLHVYARNVRTTVPARDSRGPEFG